jgi:sugar phosphate isomerase/epimerase
MPPLHPRISVNGFAWGDAPLQQQFAFARAAGFPAYGVTEAQVAAGGTAALTAALAGSDVSLAYIVLPNLFTLDEPERWAAETDRAIATIDAAAAAGAPCVYTTTGPAGTLTFEAAAAALAEAAIPVREHAGRRGVRLLVEIANQLRADLSFLATLRDAVDVAHEAGLGVCADLLWCWRERDLRATLRRGADLIGLVQVSDCRFDATAMPCRLVPGDGDLPLERIIGWLLEDGYADRFDLELAGPEISAEGIDRALQRGAERLSALLTQAGG